MGRREIQFSEHKFEDFFSGENLWDLEEVYGGEMEVIWKKKRRKRKENDVLEGGGNRSLNRPWRFFRHVKCAEKCAEY